MPVSDSESAPGATCDGGPGVTTNGGPRNRRDREIRQLQDARPDLGRLSDAVEGQRGKELRLLHGARFRLDELGDRVQRQRAGRLRLLRHVRAPLGALAEQVERHRSAEAAAQVAALQALAGKPALEKLRRLGATAPPEPLDFLKVLGVHLWEEAHSNVLRWLLDPVESHGTGGAFLRRLMKRTAKTAKEQHMTGLAPARVRDADWSQVDVKREWNYIDILILNRREKIVCAIENKVRASEGINADGVSQLTRYRELIEEEFPNHARHFVFLTPDGRISQIEEERRFWIPESYEAVYQTVRNLREQLDELETTDDAVAGTASAREAGRRQAHFALAQYETTLRRNIVKARTEVEALARRVYLEHREAIELARQHKPDYKAEFGPKVLEAVSGVTEANGLLLDTCSNRYVRFRPKSWDRFEAQRTGTGWKPSKTLLLFEAYLEENPLDTKLSLYLGPGSDAAIRERLYECAVRNPQVFKPRGKLKTWNQLLKDGPALLTEDDLGTAWDDGAAVANVQTRLNEFFQQRFPQIDELVSACFEPPESP